MHRIDSTTVEADKFGAGKDGFTEGTPGVTAATETTDDWFDGVQEEIIAPIEGMGITLIKNTRNQLRHVMHAIALSVSASNLTEQATPSVETMRGVTWVDWLGLYIAVGGYDGAVDASIYTSPDGVAWSEQANGAAFNLYAITHNGTDTVVAVGLKTGVNPMILSSANGLAWVIRTPTFAKNLNLYGVCWDSSLSLFIAVGEFEAAADSYILTSPDGLTWTEQTTTNDGNLNAVASDGSGHIVAVGDGTDKIATSTDGINWTDVSAITAVPLYAVAYGNGVWIATGWDGGVDNQNIIRSIDNGANWSATTTQDRLNLFGVCFGDGLWMAVGENDGSMGHVLISASGDAWHSVYNAKNVTLEACCFGAAEGGGMFVLVGQTDGGDSYLLTSLRAVMPAW